MPSDLWDDLVAESQRPGATMTITKAQYAALLALGRQLEQEARTLERAEVIAELRAWSEDNTVMVYAHHPNDVDHRMLYLDDVLAELSRLGERE